MVAVFFDYVKKFLELFGYPTRRGGLVSFNFVSISWRGLLCITKRFGSLSSVKLGRVLIDSSSLKVQSCDLSFVDYPVDPVIQGTEFLPDANWQFRVDLGCDIPSRLAALGQDIAEGINDHAMAGKGNAPACPCTVARYEVGKILVGPGLVEQLPGRQPCQWPGGSNKEEDSALVDHEAVEFGKAQIVAGADPRPAPGQVDDGDLVAGGEQLFFLGLKAEEMDLPVLGEEAAIWTEEQGGVVKMVAVTLDKTADHGMGRFLRDLLPQGGDERPVNFLAVGAVTAEGKEAGGPQFGQQKQVGGWSFIKETEDGSQVFLFGLVFYFQLDGGDLNHGIKKTKIGNHLLVREKPGGSDSC